MMHDWAELKWQAPALASRLALNNGRFCAIHDGLRFDSAFQPIYSLSHGRVVGHEALLRASTPDGQAVPPPQVFDVADARALHLRDHMARLVHVANYGAMVRDEQWLFLNVHPSLFTGVPADEGARLLDRMEARFGLPPARVVLEVLESVVCDASGFEAMVQALRGRGCLIALDDFGAGHSNFDRVWRLRPEIVKLDRNLIVRATTDRAVRRMLVQIVSLLHECGALVLMEGIETANEAFVALEADADLVQGYLFGRPQASPMPAGHAPPALAAVWQEFDARWREDQQSTDRRFAPYLQAIAGTAARLQDGASLDDACAALLALPNVDACYLLGADGRQIGTNCWGARGHTSPAFEPLRDTQGARWTRRPYFRRAMQAVGTPQVTRPYSTLHGGHLSVTVSMAFKPRGEDTLHVVCGDLRLTTGP